MITRTVRTNIYRALRINDKTLETTVEEIAVPATLRKGKLFNEYCANIYGFVPGKVIETDHVEQLYGITEEDFIKYGVELDIETRKPVKK